MPRTCRALALALYTTLGNVREFASRSSQMERFYSIVGLSPSFKQARYELVRFQLDHSRLLDYGRLRRLEKEVYSLAEEPRPDCDEILKAIVE